MNTAISTSFEGVLPIMRGSSDDIKVDSRGRPVWPVSNDAEFSRLRQFASAMDFEIREVPAAEGMLPSSSMPRRSGLVVGLALANPGIAQLYAHLTGRRFTNVDHLDDLRSLRGISVVLLTTEHLSVALLETLYADPVGDAPGLILASDVVRLTSSVKRFAAALLELPPPRIRRAYVTDARHLDAVEYDQYLIAGMDATAPAVAQVLGAGAGFLAIEGHSDGIHLSLPSAGMLCALSPDSGDRQPHKPLCMVANICWRYPDTPAMSDAWTTNRLSAAKTVNARVLFNSSCFAFRAADGTLDPSYTLGCAFAESADLAAMVGYWQRSLGDEGAGEYVASGLEAGKSIGSVVRDFNGLDLVQRTGRFLALVGDPAYRASVLERCVDETVRTQEALERAFSARVCALSGRPVGHGTARSSERGFLAACIEEGLATNFHCDEDAASAVADGIIDAERAVQSGRNSSARFRAACLAFFSSFPRIENAWGSFGRYSLVQVRKACPFCGSQVAIYTLDCTKGIHRQSVICPRCDEILNAPIGVAPTLSVDCLNSGLLRLGGLPKGSLALVNLQSRYAPDSLSYDWPNDEHGVPLPEYRFPVDRLPAGQLICRVLFAWEMSIGAISIKVRGGNQGSMLHSGVVPITERRPDASPVEL